MTLKEAAQSLIEHWDSLTTADLEEVEQSIEELRKALKHQRRPMTDAQITDLVYTVSVEGSYSANLVRAIEIYHGVRDE